MTNATLALQLSTREGFEVKVSEALHHGKPTIATLAGGIPLQIQHGKTGFLVKPGDTDAVAGYMYKLWTDRDLRESIAAQAAKGVSDEVGTVGNALNWMYLASKLSPKNLTPTPAAARDGVPHGGERFQAGGRWVFDLARTEAGQPWKTGETRLPRGVFVARRRKELGNVAEGEEVELTESGRVGEVERLLISSDEGEMKRWRASAGGPGEGFGGGWGLDREEARAAPETAVVEEDD